MLNLLLNWIYHNVKLKTLTYEVTFFSSILKCLLQSAKLIKNNVNLQAELVAKRSDKKIMWTQ